jgi:hypothetical protein
MAGRSGSLAHQEERMMLTKLTRIFLVSVTMAFSAGIALAPWIPASAENSSTATGKSTDKTKKPKKTNQKDTTKPDQKSTPSSEKGEGGKY